MPKITGKPIAEIEGLKIYVDRKRPKSKGKDRIWISIRQDKPKQWRIAASLCYVNALDVRLEK